MKLIKNIFLYGLSFILTLLIIELYLDKAEIAKTNWTILAPELGKANTPGKDVVYFSEGFYIGSINKHGYLGPAYPMEKPESITRIALIGDSYVEGMHVFERDHFRTLTEQELNRNLSDSVQLLNFGKGIFDFVDMYCYDKNFSSKYNSDINLIFVHNVDFDEVRDPAMPHCEVIDDSLVINREFRESDRFQKYHKLKYIMNSAIGRLMFNCYKLAGDAPAIIFDKFYLMTLSPEELLPPVPGNVPFNEVTKLIIDEVALSDKNIMVFWDKIQPDIRDYIHQSGTKVINMYPKLEQVRKSGNDINYWAVTNEVGHLNHSGHQEVTNILTQELKEILKQPETAQIKN